MPEIRIRPEVHQLGFHWALGGSLGIIVLLSMLTEVAHPVMMLLLLGSLVALLLGWVKLLEPRFSFCITPSQIVYHHRYGQWQLPWDDVQRFDIVRVNQGLEHKELPFVGVKLRRPDAILESISLRLASRLLIEQQSLLLYARSEGGCSESGCNQDCMTPEIEGLLENNHFVSPLGSCYTGLLAMLGERMKRLHSTLGYDLFIPLNALDRPGRDFISLLNSCQRNRYQYLTQLPQQPG